MIQKKKDTGTFAEVRVSRDGNPVNTGRHETATSDKAWRYIRITYPNGVTITVPSCMDPDLLSRYIYMR